MKDNFKFSGFPENNEIEVPDPPAPKPKMGDPKTFIFDLGKMDVEELKKILPKEAIDQLEELAQFRGSSVDEMLANATAMAQQMTSGLMPGLSGLLDQLGDSLFGEDDEYDPEETEDDVDAFHYELADAKYLSNNIFGSIECVEDEQLYEHFIEKYGSDSTKYLDPNIGIKSFAYTQLTAQLPLDNVKNLKFLEANDRFILFYAETDIPDTYGFFVAFFKSENDFSMYIPEFRNTFNVVDGSVSLYKVSENEGMFTIEDGGNVIFDQISIPSLEFAINFALAPKKKTLFTPHQFGHIKNIMPAINNDGMFLKVGNITSNESPESILLKKDAELDLSETVFPLYFNFGRVISKDSLMEISQILFKTDLNQCKLLDSCELKYTSDHRLYIDIDLGEF